MDDNKLKLLRNIKYKIKGCRMCRYGHFKPGTEWGTCAMYVYSHLKHTGVDREMSIHKNGICDNYVADLAKTDMLGKFDEFAKGD